MWYVGTYVFVWNLHFVSLRARVVATVATGALHFALDARRRFRLFRIERALRGVWTWWYVPFGVFIALMIAARTFFAWLTVHAVSAEGLWDYSDHARRLDLALGLIMGVTSHALLQVVWRAVFQ